MKKAEKQGHVDEAAKVIGYLDWAAGKTHSAFWGFKVSYEHDPNTRNPQDILGWHRREAVEVAVMIGSAEKAWNSLSEKVRDELTMWIGRYGHEELTGMTSETI